jgi:hypothetical protein
MTNRIGQATPGPWIASQRKSGGWHILGADGELRYIAVVEDSEYFYTPPANEANANLIAAAPDMFEALELVEPALVAAVAEADAGGPNEGLDLLCGFVKRALAKARGEQPAREQVL